MAFTLVVAQAALQCAHGCESIRKSEDRTKAEEHNHEKGIGIGWKTSLEGEKNHVENGESQTTEENVSEVICRNTFRFIPADHKSSAQAENGEIGYEEKSHPYFGEYCPAYHATKYDTGSDAGQSALCFWFHCSIRELFLLP